MDIQQNRFPVMIFLIGACTGLVAFTGVLPSIRPLLVFVFLLVCPGLVFVNLLRLDNLILVATLSFALSLAIDTAVATLLLYSDAWSWPRTMFIILAITLAGTLLNVTTGRIKHPEGWQGSSVK